LKPDNILITGEGINVKVLDFGLAKIVHPDADSDGSASPMTTPGAVMGTFGYMSPEQLSGGVVDHRTDLFSIGVIAVEVLTGRRPFGGKTYHEQLSAILHQPFQLEHTNAETAKLDEVLQKSLSKNPEDRFASASEMQKSLIAAMRNYVPGAKDAEVNLDADTAIF
jgi:serine/threonine protein kinase